jgi:hypothetical protein
MAMRAALGADDAAAQDDDVAAPRAGHAAEQEALAAALLLEVRRADLHGHAAGHLAHRAQERQRAVGPLDRLVGDRAHAAVDERLRELWHRGQVQVREEHQARAEVLVLRGQGLLHLHHHLRGPCLGRAVDDARPCAHEVLVADARAQARATLDEHRVACPGQALYAARIDAHAVFAGLDLRRYADDHAVLLTGSRAREHPTRNT